jgi:hypothetical protein
MPTPPSGPILRLELPVSRPVTFRSAVLLLVLLLAGGAFGQTPALPVPERVATGVELYRWSDPGLLTPPGPVAVQLLRLDPRRIVLATALAVDVPPGRATVVEVAARRQALAAINAGFFAIGTGVPTGLLKVAGKLMSGTAVPRGAVGILPRSWLRPPRLVFDQVSVARPQAAAPVYTPALGSAARSWARAASAVGGAGLLVHRGVPLGVEAWARERLREGFATERHPRTMIGTDDRGAIWLVTVDGRNPSLSLGMRFEELQSLARCLRLQEALNLDGGGSTTMVVHGAIVNHPSDLTGPRPVSDVLLVFVR